LINLLVVAATALLAVTAYASFHKGALADGLKEVGLALILLGICFMFTWPNRCRVTTTRGTACLLEAYGYLLGCPDRHLVRRLKIRLGMIEASALRHARPASGLESQMPGIWAKDSVVTLTIESSKSDTSGFVFGLVSALTGVASVVISLVPALH
jgi:hypothetical protein